MGKWVKANKGENVTIAEAVKMEDVKKVRIRRALCCSVLHCVAGCCVCGSVLSVSVTLAEAVKLEDVRKIEILKIQAATQFATYIDCIDDF